MPADLDVYWFEQGSAGVPEDDEWLSPTEARDFGKLRGKRRDEWRLGRWTAKRSVARYLNCGHSRRTLAAIEIRPSEMGAPEAFTAGAPLPVAISISHCGGRAVCAVTEPGAAIGCDIEQVAPRFHGFIEDYFAPQERAFVARAPLLERAFLVNLIWSAKESLMKAAQLGLRLDPRGIVVRPADARSRLKGWHPLELEHAGRIQFVGRWWQSGEMVRTLAASWGPAGERPVGQLCLHGGPSQR